nr:MAG TPA: hypothetical protein [Crassvirales sp.]
MGNTCIIHRLNNMLIYIMTQDLKNGLNQMKDWLILKIGGVILKMLRITS